jgi:hypothetical protein
MCFGPHLSSAFRNRVEWSQSLSKSGDFDQGSVMKSHRAPYEHEGHHLDLLVFSCRPKYSYFIPQHAS